MITEAARKCCVDSGFDRSTLINSFFSIKLRPNSLLPFYKFKLRKSSSNTDYILVKKDSAILSFLESGQELNINYFSEKKSDLGTWLKTKINYVFKEVRGRFKGHYVISLSTIHIC
jgi:hypothetical protein